MNKSLYKFIIFIKIYISTIWIYNLIKKLNTNFLFYIFDIILYKNIIFYKNYKFGMSFIFIKCKYCKYLLNNNNLH
jgi:hypothetical protein